MGTSVTGSFSPDSPAWYTYSGAICFFLKSSNFFSATKTSHRPVYCSSLTGACSVVKSSAEIPSICALTRTIMSFVTRITGVSLFRRPIQTFKIRLSFLCSGKPSGSFTSTQLTSRRSVPPPGRETPSSRFPAVRSDSRYRIACRAFAPLSPSAFFNPSSSSRTASGNTR